MRKGNRVFKRTFLLAWQLFIDELAKPHVQLLTVTQVLLMVFVMTLTLTSTSIQRHLKDNMENLLGADAVVSQHGALADKHIQRLNALSNSYIYTQSVETTLTHTDKWQRASLKAVDDTYPLHGKLKVSDDLETPSYSTDMTPASGEIWLDSRLAASLGVNTGATLNITDLSFKVTHILHHEPDRLLEGHSVAMRAMLNRHDFSQLNFDDDTVHYRYLINATKSQTDDIIAFQKHALPSAQVRHRHGAHPLALFWQRTENLIGLASILLLFMASIAIYQLSRLQIKKEQYFSAVCISLGASRHESLRVSVYKWLIHMSLILPLVMGVAILCHWTIVNWLSQTLPDLRWELLLATTFWSYFASVLLLVLFQLPIWLSLRKSSVKQLLLNPGQQQQNTLSIMCTLCALTIVTLVYSDNALLTFMMLCAMFVCVAVISLLSWLSLTVGEKLTQQHSGLLPFATFMMRQRLVSKSTQIMGVGLCVFLLLFTLMLLRDLGNTMQAYNRQFDGNLLVTQANLQQMQAITLWAEKHNAEIRQHKPFMYAKLTHINQQSLNQFVDHPSESLSAFQHNIRLHWTQAVPANNRIINGQWWEAASKDWRQVSIEQEVMTDLGLNIGDNLTFAIAGKTVDFTIVASHEYKPGAGSITFWVQMPAVGASFIDVPHYAMASIEVDNAHFPSIGNLWQRFPTLRMVSIKEMAQRFDSTLTLVTQVMSGFSLLIASLAAIVIVSSVLTYERSERKKNSVIMSFGLPRKLCLTLNLIEWCLTGTIAALGAIVGTWLAGSIIYQSQFSIPYQPSVMWLLTALMIIIIVVVAIGYLASRHTLSSSIHELLTE